MYEANNKWRLNIPVSPTSAKVVLIITLFVLISLLAGGMIFLYGNIFDGVRAYVKGEGLWAKAQKDAVFHLSRYSYSQSNADYDAYLNALEVIDGDKQARLALSETPPNVDRAKIGFLLGKNHPDDVQAMIDFFLTFRRISYMRDAIATWEAGDQGISALKRLGEQIRSVRDTDTKTAQIDQYRVRLERLNDELQELENRFSSVLGDGARWVKKTTWWITYITLSLFIGVGILVSRQIIKGIAQSERRLIDSELRFRRLKESNTIGIITWHMDGTIDEANDLFLTMLGYRRQDLSCGVINWREITPIELRDRDQQAIDELLSCGRCEPFEKALIHKQGHWVPILVGAAMLNSDRDRGIAYVMDMSERKKAEQQLKLAATVFSGGSDGILITDPAMRIVSVNQALCAMSGYLEPELIGNRPTILQSGYTSQEVYSELWEALNTNGQWQGDIVDRKKNGMLLPVRVSINQIKNSDDQITHFVAILSDISERKAEEAYLRHIAYHDSLTGLANRALFDNRLERAIKLAIRNDRKFAVLFLDLDKFKPVNDVFGHEIGDKLLQHVARRLVRSVRETDTVTRLGGDEFVVLLEHVDKLEKVDKTLQHIVDAVCEPYQIDGHNIEIGVSVGISLYPDHGTDAATLLHRADMAMYHVKESKPERSENNRSHHA